jgi:hypothetical protein
MKCHGSNERELWAAVLQQAIDEAEKKYDSDNREEARRFINDPEGMFPVICNIFGIDVEIARQRLNNKWRE